MKTYQQKPAEVSRVWYHINAAGLPLGRIASEAAQILLGKAKVGFSPHVDAGDFVVITSAKSVTLSGRKSEEAVYHYSGYPGGLRRTTHAELIDTNPTKLVRLAVAGMVPNNRLKKGRLARLKIYADEQHEHAAQQPKAKEIKL